MVFTQGLLLGIGLTLVVTAMFGKFQKLSKDIKELEKHGN